jgi:hypothetical protein
MPYRPAEDAFGLLPDSRQDTHCWNDDGALPPLVLAAGVLELAEEVPVPELADEVPELSEEVPELTDEVPDAAADVSEPAEGVVEVAGAW